MNNFNIPPQILQMMQSKNPQQAALNMLKGMNNPIANNVIQLVNNGEYGALEQIGRNMCANKGINPDEMFKQISNYK